MFRNRLLAFVVLVSMIVTLMPLGQPAAAVSTTVVISQVYGGGGNAGATFRNDFIELFNRGAASVNLTGWSVQYASSAGTTWATTSLLGAIQPGQYYLVQEAQGAGGTTSLPSPDAIGTINMSLAGAKVALVNSTTAQSGSGCPFSAAIVDFVGSDGANCSETAATPALNNTMAAKRKLEGCTETDNNLADFDVSGPAPRNTASPLHFCTGDNAPVVTATSPLANATDVSFNTNIGITFSEAVDVSSAWYTISCATSGSHTATQSGGPTTFSLDPAVDFAFSESCTVTVLASEVTDQDTVDPPNNMLGSQMFSFTTEATPPPPTFIHDIQGAAHISPLVGQTPGKRRTRLLRVARGNARADQRPRDRWPNELLQRDPGASRRWHVGRPAHRPRRDSLQLRRRQPRAHHRRRRHRPDASGPQCRRPFRRIRHRRRRLQLRPLHGRAHAVADPRTRHAHGGNDGRADCERADSRDVQCPEPRSGRRLREVQQPRVADREQHEVA